MGRVLFISALIHAVLLVVIPLLPGLRPAYDQGLEVYEVQLMELPVNEQPEQATAPEETQPVAEPDPAPPAEEETEEPAIPDEPAPKPKRTVLKPPAAKPRQSLEERLNERLQAEDEKRPAVEERDAPRGESAPAPTTTARVTAARFPYGWYLSVIQGKVSSNWTQPSARLIAEESLTATVSFTIRRDGSVDGIRVVRSSGRSTVDQSAGKAVRDSAPFPPLPDDYRRDMLDVTIDFTIFRE